MTDLIFRVLSWPTFALALLVWGFAPGALLRLIVLAFSSDDPRRTELLGELYGVPRMERPFWVAEQLEVALVEGLGHRLAWAVASRIFKPWHLGSGVERNRQYPNTFWIPSKEERESIVSGMDVRLVFETKLGTGERIWVTVAEVRRRKLVGKLVSTPNLIPHLKPGDTVKFERDHIIDTWDEYREEYLASGQLVVANEPDPFDLDCDELQRRTNDPSALN